ncbi:MAG: hypothetical protein Q8P15_02545 [Nanoarchaeota archaeon]|nr:hypothetical protein [Nanoarchaeota archaeon]
MPNLKQNKNGQIGETMTWVVATLIIIVILAISIFISSFYPGKSKKIQEPYLQTADVLASKSMFSYMLTEDSERGKIYTQLKEDGNLSNFNGNFALKVFRGLYQKDYLNNPSNIWLGVVVNTGENLAEDKEPIFDILESLPNDFFGPRPGGPLGTAISYHTIPHTSEKIKLDENKSVELVLIGK